MKNFRKYFPFTPFDIALWCGAVCAVVLSFVLCKNTAWLNLIGTLIGVTGLIFLAKGNVIGQILSVIFSAYYGFVSYSMKYYGEMITYLGMTAPIAIAAVVSWLRHPYGGNRTQVAVSTPSKREYAIILALSAAVTFAFYFILRALGTSNLIWSTVSVFTSFLAVTLTQRRSPYFPLAYACNDVILIVLWSLAASENSENIALVVCFCVFLTEDLYSLFSWLRMRRRQRAQSPEDAESASPEAASPLPPEAVSSEVASLEAAPSEASSSESSPEPEPEPFRDAP